MNTLIEKLREKLFDKIEVHVLKYQVSLGSYRGTSELDLPIGSGIFVKFRISSHVIYGILTASHVIKELKFGLVGQPAFVGLLKLQNGDTIACSVSFAYIYGCVEIEGFHSDSKDGYRPDIAFIALGIDGLLPDHELIAESSFYDLDTNTKFVICDPQIASAFYRGAAPKRPDGFLDTGLYLGGEKDYDSMTKLIYNIGKCRMTLIVLLLEVLGLVFGDSFAKKIRSFPLVQITHILKLCLPHTFTKTLCLN